MHEWTPGLIAKQRTWVETIKGKYDNPLLHRFSCALDEIERCHAELALFKAQKFADPLAQAQTGPPLAQYIVPVNEPGGYMVVVCERCGCILGPRTHHLDRHTQMCPGTHLETEQRALGRP